MISLDEAKRHLRVDHDQDDEDIAKKLMLAKAVIADYIGFSIDMPPREDFTSEDAYFATLEKTNNQSAVIDAATFLALGELYARLCSRTLWLSMASHSQGQPLSGFQTNR